MSKMLHLVAHNCRIDPNSRNPDSTIQHHHRSCFLLRKQPPSAMFHKTAPSRLPAPRFFVLLRQLCTNKKLCSIGRQAWKDRSVCQILQQSDGYLLDPQMSQQQPWLRSVLLILNRRRTSAARRHPKRRVGAGVRRTMRVQVGLCSVRRIWPTQSPCEHFAGCARQEREEIP